MIEALFLLLTGLVSGIVGGVLGIGGGVVMVPALAIGLGVPQTLAQGTVLAAMVPGAVLGARTYRREGEYDRRAARTMAVIGVPGAALGAYLALQVPNELLARGFGAFMLVVAWRLWPGRRSDSPARAED